MRIISGKYNRRIIKFVPNEDTRETQEKIRGALFNSFMPYFDQGIALDLFAGSGAMGLELISRGASFCYFNDISRTAYNIINENIISLDVQNQTKLYNLDYKKCLEMVKDKKFDIIFLDPPYKLDIIDDIIDYVLNHEMLNNNGLLVLEYALESKDHGLTVLKEKTYGYKKVKILRRDL